MHKVRKGMESSVQNETGEYEAAGVIDLEKIDGANVKKYNGDTLENEPEDKPLW